MLQIEGFRKAFHPQSIAADRHSAMEAAHPLTQQYAIYALSPLIDEDENIKKSFIGLVGDWDELTRKTIATVLKGTKDPKLLQAAERQLKEESNDQIKSLLKEIINNNKTSEQINFDHYSASSTISAQLMSISLEFVTLVKKTALKSK